MKKLLLLLLILVGGSYLAWHWFDREQKVAQGFDGASTAPVVWDASFTPTPVTGFIEAHPGLGAIGSSTMHADGFQSDTHPAAGPMGPTLQVRSRTSGSGTPRECATFVFRSDGKLVSLCGGFSGFRIVMIDPETLDLLASHDLPMRPSSFEAVVKRNIDVVFSDTSGGAYLFMDNKDRVVFGDISNPEVLESAGVRSADAVILTIPDEDAVLRACEAVRAMNASTFISARTNFLSKGMMASRLGADHVTVEELATAESMAHEVITQLTERVLRRHEREAQAQAKADDAKSAAAGEKTI